MEDLMNEIDRIIEARIETYRFDIMKHRLELSLLLYSKEGWIKCDVCFVDVTTALFINNMYYGRKNVDTYEEGDCLELTDIHILRGKNYINIDSEIEGYWTKNFPSEGNIALEIWSHLLVLETTGIVIDGRHFDLPQP
jgi:hypothetical protein